MPSKEMPLQVKEMPLHGRCQARRCLYLWRFIRASAGSGLRGAAGTHTHVAFTFLQRLVALRSVVGLLNQSLLVPLQELSQEPESGLLNYFN